MDKKYFYYYVAYPCLFALTLLNAYFIFLAPLLLKITLANKALHYRKERIYNKHQAKNRTKQSVNLSSSDSLYEILMAEQNKNHIHLISLEVREHKNLIIIYTSTFLASYHLLTLVFKSSCYLCDSITLRSTPTSPFLTTTAQCRPHSD